MIIRKLDRNTYDVFGGMGWPCEDAVPYASNAQWTRIRRFHWGMKPIAGTFLPRQTLHIVIDAILRHPEGSIDNV
jgi:hypothetical protein